MNLTRLIFAVLLALAVAGTACGGDDDGDASPSASQSGTPRPTPAANLPADFPESFPIYPDMVFDQGARFGNQVLAAFTAPASSTEVAAFYREVLAEEPWELLSDDSNSQGNVITLSIRNEDAETRGTVTLSEPTPGAGTEVSTSFIIPQTASPLPSLEPFGTPSPEATEADETDEPDETGESE